MSADTTTQTEIRFQKRRLLLPNSVRSTSQKKGFELTREENFINGDQDIFDILTAKQAVEQES